MDSLDGKKNNWSKAIPTNKKIINEYNLSKETTEYRNAFLLDFRDNFKKEYEEAFRDENFKDPLTTKESALIHGGNIGSLEGMFMENWIISAERKIIGNQDCLPIL